MKTNKAMVFDTKKRAEEYAAKQNKKSRIYKYIIVKYFTGYIVRRVKK